MSALSSLPADERERIIAEIPAAEVIRLHFEWLAWARDDQVSPLCTAAGTPWHTWLLLGGRGSGKTRSGAEWVRAKALGYEDVAGEPARRLALIGLTIGQVRSVMVEGVSGLLTVHSPRERPHYDVARNEITWSNGAVAQMFAADDPDSLRGPQFDAAWCDEFAKWRRPAYARDWAEGAGDETMLAAAHRHLIQVAPATAAAGDVLIFRYRQRYVAKHAAILAGSTLIHAIEGTPVCEVPLSGWWRRRIAGAFSFPGVTG